MDAIAINILNGLSYGMVLFIIAAGFSLIFGVMGVFNLAHGSLYLLGAYIGLTVVGYGANFLLAALAGALGVVIIGLVLQRVFLSRLYGQINDQCLLTLGFVYIIGNVVLWIWGGFTKMGAPPPIVSESFGIGEYSFPAYRLLLILIGLLIAIGLWFFQEKTRAGSVVRAGMDDKPITMALGMNYGLYASAIFLLGAFLSGFAGFVGTPMLGIRPAVGFDILLLAVVVVVIGGVGSLQGALLGAILIGLMDAFGKVFFPDLANFTIYLVMIIVLLVKPVGLLGRKA